LSSGVEFFRSKLGFVNFLNPRLINLLIKMEVQDLASSGTLSPNVAYRYCHSIPIPLDLRARDLFYIE
jgi:hypothetical protein